jgi:transposase InsO family protein
MIALIRLVLGLLAAPFRSKLSLEVENAALRQQLIVLRRKLRGRVRLSNGDRLFFVWLYRLFPSITRAILIIRPDTLVRWHRVGFRRYWRWKSCRRVGRPRIDRDLRALIRRMSVEDVLWGAPRIHGELLKLGFEVAQSTVARYMVKPHGPPSQTWRTFLRNHAPDVAAIDLFVVPTIGFGLLYGLVVIQIARRNLVWVNVTSHPTAEWVAQQLTEAFPWQEAPRHLIRDHDAVYGGVYIKRINAMGIRDHPTAPRSPWQNPYAEQLIGSIRRECLDRVVVTGEAHLRRILRRCANYYNRARTHRSLSKDCPPHRPAQAIGTISSSPVVGGLHHVYSRM